MGQNRPVTLTRRRLNGKIKLSKLAMGGLSNQFAILGSIPFRNWMALALAIIVFGIVVAWWIDRIES